MFEKLNFDNEIVKVEIEEISPPLCGIYHYDAKVWRSYDNGERWWYNGKGKYFTSIEDANRYKIDVEAGRK